MKRIFKYQLPELYLEPGAETIEIPKNSTLLNIDMQDEKVTLWYIVDPEVEKETHTFLVLGTGSIVPELEDAHLEFLKTVFQGPFVWHVFEVVDL